MVHFFLASRVHSAVLVFSQKYIYVLYFSTLRRRNKTTADGGRHSSFSLLRTASSSSSSWLVLSASENFPSVLQKRSTAPVHTFSLAVCAKKKNITSETHRVSLLSNMAAYLLITFSTVPMLSPVIFSLGFVPRKHHRTFFFLVPVRFHS